MRNLIEKPGVGWPPERDERSAEIEMPENLAEAASAETAVADSAVPKSRSGRPSPQKRTMESRHEQAREQLRSYLQSEGIMESGPQNEIIVDVPKIAGFDYDLFSKKSGVATHHAKGLRFRVTEELLDYFATRPVYSREDWERKQAGEEAIEPRPLFYQPVAEDAFDAKAIKNARFYLLPTADASSSWQELNKYYKRQHGYSAEEACLAAIIYHPDFGDGFRDEDGRLLVKEKPSLAEAEPKQISISSNWITRNERFRDSSWFLSGQEVRFNPILGGPSNMSKWSIPRQTIMAEEYRRLRESGLLEKDDFRFLEGSSTGEIERTEREITGKGIMGASSTMVNKDGEKKSSFARYLLGQAFVGKTFVKLADNLYGVVGEVQGIKKVTHVFRPASIEQIEAKRIEYREKHGREPKSANIFFGSRKAETPRPIPFDATAFSGPRRADESPADYARRVAEFDAIRQYDKLQTISRELSARAGIGLHNLSLVEQNALATYAFQHETNYQKLLVFAEKFGLKGLKTFLSCEYGLSKGDQIIELSEKTAPAVFERIISGYARLINRAGQVKGVFEKVDFGDSLDPVLAADFPLEVEEAILRRAKDLLLALASQPNQPAAKAKVAPDDLITAMNGLDVALGVVSSLADSQSGDFAVTEKKTRPDNPGNFFFTVAGDDDSLYHLKVFVRPEAETGAQARINFEVDFQTAKPNQELVAAFSQAVVHQPHDLARRKERKSSVLRLGIDLETGGESPAVSLDFGRASRQSDDLVRTGDPLGRTLSLLGDGLEHHTAAPFRTELAQPRVFAALARKFEAHLSQKEFGAANQLESVA